MAKEIAKTHKEWERPLTELEDGIARLRDLARREPDHDKRSAIEQRLRDIEKRRDDYIRVFYSKLGPWEKVLVARAERRPYALDYVNGIFTNFVELDGD